jgi:hypothetical protein
LSLNAASNTGGYEGHISKLFSNAQLQETEMALDGAE